MKKKVSMEMLANELGVSKVTISKALNMKEGVSDNLREKIINLAKSYNYSMPKSSETKSLKIAILMNRRFLNFEGGNSFYFEMCEAIIHELHKSSNIGVVITPSINTVENDFDFVENKGDFDGIIFLGILCKSILNKFKKSSKPYVYVDVYDKTQKTDSFVTENLYSSYEITNLLIEAGHKNIAFVGTVGSTTSITDRYLGYLRRMIDEGISIEDTCAISDRDENGRVIPIDVTSKAYTAYVCNCDETAFELIKTLRTANISVPDDVSVVGFDDSIYAKISDPPLTTVAVDVSAIAKVAVKGILKKVNGTDKRNGIVRRIPGQIIQRNSVKVIKERDDSIE